jgi:Domain of unknown function (DUF4304)
MNKNFGKSIREHLDSILLQHGFSRNRSTWTRKFDQFTDVIFFQNNSFDGKFNLDLGIYSEPICNELWLNMKAEARPETCVIRTSAGLLKSNYEREYRWEFHDPSSMMEFLNCVTEEVLPFFGLHHTFSSMAIFLEERGASKYLLFPDSFFLASVLLRCERKADACKLLWKLRQKNSSVLSELASLLLTKYNCNMN